MITFAALLPHSPLLIKTIGKESTEQLEDTRESLTRIAQELYANHPDVLVIISSQSADAHQTCSLNVHDIYNLNFKEFGDLSTYRSFHTDLHLATEIQRHFRDESLPISLHTEPSLDYQMGIPLSFFDSMPAQTKIVPFSSCDVSAKQQVQFGRALKEVCMASQKRIAILAVGDLSHTLTSSAPAGFHKAGAVVDQTIKQAIEHMSLSKLLAIKEETLQDAQESAYAPLLVLMGALERMAVEPEILSYEHPFGVGQLVALFHLAST